MQSSPIAPRLDQRVWTVVVNWRQTAATLACLASVEAAGADPRAVVVIDNGSGDDFAVRLRERYPLVTLLAEPRNLGFAAGVNIGLRHAMSHDAAAVLVLNNDAVVAPDAIHELWARMERSPRLGVLTAKVFLSRAREHLWAVGGTFNGRRVVELGAGERDTGQYDEHPLDFAYGCALLLRSAMLEDVGGFDEGFFLYYEDIDLCLRAKAAGWQIAMEPRARAWHEGSKSTRGEPAAKAFHHARSRVLFFSRHVPAAKRARFAGSEMAFIAHTIAGHVYSGEPKSALAYLLGTIDGFRERASRDRLRPSAVAVADGPAAR